MKTGRLQFGLVSVLGFLLIGCASDDDDACALGTAAGCDDGFVCEAVLGGEPACFLPIELHGQVFDATDADGVGGASVVALDANGAARSTTVQTADDGTYALWVPLRRTNAQGAWAPEQVTLRVAAQGYRPFPTAPRVALPIDLAGGQEDAASQAVVIEGLETDVALVALAGDSSGLVTITGRVHPPEFGLPDQDVGGVLVLAEQGGQAVSTAVAGNGGAFVLYNVPMAATTLRGVRAGLGVTPQNLTPEGDTTDVVLMSFAGELGSVVGSLNIVNAPGGSQTSVILVVASTFTAVDATTVRGEAPGGLRAAPVSGVFRIEGVPPGDYVVLAAFENDDLVRDPDDAISGTDIVRITVPEGAGETTVPQSFKITAALAMVSPGADGTEDVAEATPTFIWSDDSSEDGYELRVYDVLGTLLLEETDLPRVSGGATVEYTWDTAALVPGMICQVRVRSFRDTNDGRSYISATEDLEGVFRYVPSAGR